MRQTLWYALLCGLGMLLVMASCNRATRSSQESLLLKAASGNDTKTVVTLAKGVRNINIQDHIKLTPLHYAVRHDNEAMVKALIAHGADPNLQDEFGWTPVHEAVKRNYPVTLRQLLTVSTVDLTLKNKSGSTPLSLANSLGYSEMAKLLKKAGARK